MNKLQQKFGTTSEGKKRIVLEEGGEPVTIGLKRKNPFSTNGCKFGDNQCIVSPSSDCSAMGATYIIRCLSCKQTVDPTLKENPKLPGQVRSAHYIGMTACSIHNRMDAHKNGHQKKKEGNPLHRHDCESHNGEIQSYQTELIQMDRGLLHLSMREAILIEGQNSILTMNDKMEHGRGNMVRLTANRT